MIIWVALLAGVGQAASFAPSGLWGLQTLSLAALAALAWRQAPGRAALLGWAFGIGWFGAGLWWLFISLHDFGGLASPLAGLAVLLLAAFLALYPAAALAVWARVCGERPGGEPPGGERPGGERPVGERPGRRVLLFACAWSAAELARASWFTGFPWIAGGYAHSDGPLAAWAPWVGVYGMGALSAGVAAALAALRARSRLRALPLLLTLPLALAGTLLPSQFSTPVGTLRVSLLQPAVPQSQKFDAAHVERNLDRLLEQMEAARAPLVVAPESVLPLPLAYVRAEQQERLYAASRERTIWFGTFLGDERQGFVNSMLALRQGESVHSYGKRHLLPFGEFIPPGLDWFVRALNIPIDSQQAGTHQRPLQIDGLRLRALICYEVLFGEDIAASAVDGPDAAEVFVNTSNLAWFGRLMVQDQHLQFIRLRALEFQRPVLHATNTGATAQVDHRGRVLARLAPLVRGQLDVTVEGRRGSTPYARGLHAAGLWPLWALALAPLLAPWLGSIWADRRRPAP
jgi:apolipoprotein N-acyltransferase